MIDWDIYEPSASLNVKDDLSKEIILTLAVKLPRFFEFPKKRRRPKRTRWVKTKLAILGDNKDYKVYANGLPPKLKPKNGGTFKNAEWMYDLHWYTEGDKHYTTRRLPLWNANGNQSAGVTRKSHLVGSSMIFKNYLLLTQNSG